MDPVIVLGEGITALGVLRCFARQGVPVFGTAAPSDPMRKSRYYRHLPGLDGALQSSVDGLAYALDRCGLPRAVLAPCSDRLSAAVSALPAAYDARFLRCMPSPEAVHALNDKGELATLLERVGVDHPFTRIVSGPDELDDLMQRTDESLFLKPRDSQRFFSIYNVKAFRVAGIADARARLADIQSHDLEIILQGYVPGPASNHYFIDGFRDSTGCVRARFARRRLRIYPVDFGNSTAMVSVPVAEMGEAAAQLDRLLEATAYRGIFSAEFKRDERDGRFRLLEVNTRPWWFVDFAVRAGADVCTLMYRDALGEPVSDLPPYRIGERCVYPYYDFAALRELRARGEGPGWVRWLIELAGARQPVLALDDPLPAAVGTVRLLRGRGKR